ncbi:MAG: N-acetylmuramoyl-L-alanine amidase [Campylobacterota bacterium]|nr:N-acetylmuramoyl-L-alanine amidase [Campylobacterota bacterium]
MKIGFYIIAMLFFVGCSSNSPDRSDDLIVIDAGHGGHDSGARFAGKHEKDLVLKITKKLYRELKSKGYRVYLTRDDDRFLKLGQRTRIADRKDAKLFISVHANAIANKSRYEIAEGVETYFLQKTRDARSQRIAARENASVLQGTDQLSRDVIIDSVLTGPKIIQSHKLAIDVQNGMVRNLNKSFSNVKDGGVRPGPFYILVGASRPSILVEVGYLTNTKERERLYLSAYQDRIVQGIVEGVGIYIDNRKREVGF